MDDLISRQAAIKAVGWYSCHSGDELLFADNVLKQLPSEELEIVHCRDCKWWDKIGDSRFGYCKAIKHLYYTENWEIGIRRTYKGDFFCGDAELRETEIEDGEE